MAGPQVQHSQRPNSAYYTGLNGSGNSGNSGPGSGGGAVGMATSASHTGLHALRQVSNETELIYRGSHSNGTVNELPSTAAAHRHQLLTGRLPSASASAQQQRQQVSSIAGTGSSATDALINTITSGGGSGGAGGSAGGGTVAVPGTSLGLKKSSTQRSIEIIVDASQCGRNHSAVAGAGAGTGGSVNALDGEDVEQGNGGDGGGQESNSSHRKSSRHRHRPLHRRLISYLRNLFQGSTTQNDSELEEFETPARYRPDSLSALSRATRFTEDEIKRIYRGFKAECPTGVVKEDTFKVIYSQFFPQGANPTLYAHYVFNTLDQDRSGIVSFEDFVQGLSILSRGSVEEKLRWTFSLYDINGDGFITREEMTDIVTAIYELMGRLPDEFPEEEKIKGKVEQIFQKMDTNRDGVVTLEEFLEACRNDDAISRSMSYTVRQRRRSRSHHSRQHPPQDHHYHRHRQEQQHKEPEKRKSNHNGTKGQTNKQQQTKQTHQLQHQHQKRGCCHIIEMDGESSTTTTTATTSQTSTGTSAVTGTTCPLLKNQDNDLNGYEDGDVNRDGDWEGGDETGDDNEDLDGKYFVCRHCQRPQRFTRRSNVRGRSSKSTKSKSRKRHPSQQRTKHQQPQLQRWPEINAANEQAIRFRCPQVGPQVGRDLHTPQPMHFHHPLQSQAHAHSQVKVKSKKNRRACGPKVRKEAAETPAPPTPVAAPKTPTHPGATQPLPPLSINVNDEEQGAQQPGATTPDSPSLVTVSTWYTVAKQGVSC
ncbi:hypothetical protein KR018_001043 [Drosophila ironensis]|nr:hypothetical protein KR018_001043 [Drosophila ironensis]